MPIKISIEKLAYGGEGIGHLGGKVCFIEGALPDETVSIIITEDKKKFIRGRVKEIIVPSANRIKAPCEYFGICGGCQYQHLEYAEEKKWKTLQAREYLSRALKISPETIRDLVSTNSPYHYRNSITVHSQNKQIGFISEDNENLTPVTHCEIGAKGLAPIFGWDIVETSACYRMDHQGEIFSTSQNEFFDIKIGKELILCHSRAFFQNNLAVTQLVAKQIKDWLEEHNPKTFIDIFSGVGTFTLLCAKNIPKRVCIEGSPWAIQALRKNAERTNLDIEIHQSAAERMFKKWHTGKNLSDAIIMLDPPRTGLEMELAQTLSHASPKGLFYLSCHLGSLTRDLEIILKGGHLQIQEIIPFDMFPRTKHIELLCRLVPRVH